MERATIRNDQYKLNYTHDVSTDDFIYSLYRYEDGEIPGLEGQNDSAEPTTDLWSMAIDRTDDDARNNLDALLDELMSNYKRNQTKDFGTPPPFPVP